MQDFKTRGIAAWEDFVASRKDRPYPHPDVGPDGEGADKQRELEERYFSARKCSRNTAVARQSQQQISLRREHTMARNGYKIFDSDTHVGPLHGSARRRIMTDAEKHALAGWEEYKAVEQERATSLTTKGQRRYRRRLGNAKADARSQADTWRASPACKREREAVAARR